MEKEKIEYCIVGPMYLLGKEYECVLKSYDSRDAAEKEFSKDAYTGCLLLKRIAQGNLIKTIILQ